MNRDVSSSLLIIGTDSPKEGSKKKEKNK